MPIGHVAFSLHGTRIDTLKQIVECLLACLMHEQGLESVLSKFYNNLQIISKYAPSEYGVSSLHPYWNHHTGVIENARLFFDDTSQTLERLRETEISLSLMTSLSSRRAWCLCGSTAWRSTSISASTVGHLPRLA